MRWKKFLAAHLLVIALTAVFATAADDVQVIDSKRSVLSIYSYGAAAPLRTIPESRDGRSGRGNSGGALTDVVTMPPLAISSAAATPSAKPIAARNSAAPSPGTASGPGSHSVVSPRQTSSGASGTVPANDQVVIVSWDPSPDNSVVGYKIYVGPASHHYTVTQAIGDQTTAQVTVSNGPVYVAVSSYTVEGLESVLTPELVLGGDSQTNAGPAGISASGR